METINITRHEHEGRLQGFTMYFNNTENKEVTLLLWDNDLNVWYSRTAYRGSCSVGVISESAQATVFSSDNHFQECDDFIVQNNLVKFGEHYAAWHFPTAFRIVQSNAGMLRMLKDIPQLALYPSQAGLDVVEDGNYQYTYINYILPEHEQVFSIPEYEAQIQSNPD